MISTEKARNASWPEDRGQRRGESDDALHWEVVREVPQAGRNADRAAAAKRASERWQHGVLMAEQLYLSAVDLATRYGVSKRTIWRWTSEGHLPKPEELPGNIRRWLLVDIERIED